MAKTSIAEMVWRKFVKRKNDDALIEASGVKEMICKNKTNIMMKVENT